MKNITQLSEKKITSLKKACIELTGNAIEMFKRGEAIDNALKKLFAINRHLGSRDRHYISERIFALFRWWGWIKICIKADFEIKNLIHISKITEALNYADTIVELCSKIGYNNPSLEKELSATLSNISKINSDNFKKNLLLPEFFFENLSSEFKYENIFQTFQRRPGTWLRIRKGFESKVTSFLRKNGIKFELNEKFNNIVKLIDFRGNLYNSKEYKEGLFEVQDLASQMIGLIAAPKEDEYWLDACAGAGGKTLQLIELSENKIKLDAQDINPIRLEKLKKRISRYGYNTVNVYLVDSTTQGKLKKQYDGILIDAPCSCSGTWRRNPDGRWRFTAEEIRKFSETQFTLLDALSHKLKVGGNITYATCSVFKLENEDVLERFLSAHNNFSPCEILHPITKEKSIGMIFIDGGTFDSDYVFIAKMKKVS